MHARNQNDPTMMKSFEKEPTKDEDDISHMLSTSNIACP